MYYARSGLKPVLASIAVLVLLLSGGVFAYATRLQSSGAGPNDTSSHASQTVTFKLVPVTAAGSHKAGQGEVYVIVQGHTLTIYLAISGGTPSAQLGVVMPIVSDSGDSNRTLGVVKLTDGGSGQFHVQTTLDTGSYQIGFQVYDVSNSGAPVLVLLSEPAFAQVVTSDQSSTSSTESTSSERTSSHTSTYTKTSSSNSEGGSIYLKFNLLSLPTWQHQTVPDGYPFKEGEAVLYLQSTQLYLRVSFAGAPNATFSVVLQQNGQNLTVGSTTTNREGGGYASAKLSLSPGTYHFGILLFAPTSSGQNELVALSDPRSASATVSASSTTTTTTSTTETTETETQTTNVEHEGNYVEFHLVSLPAYLLTPQPSNYPFMKGGAVIGVTSGSMYVAVSFLGTPNTSFTVVLQQNGANITVGSLITNGDGGGVLRKQLSASAGTYELGLLIYATGSGGTSTLVAVSIPRSQTVDVSPIETTTTTQSGGENSNQHGGAYFKFNPAPRASVPRGYSFGHGTAGAGIHNSQVVVSARFEGQNPNTKYALVLTVNGTMQKLGEYTTDAHGNGHIVANSSFGSGTFVIGLSVYDVSTFSAPTLVLTSDPASVILHTSEGESSTTSTTESQNENETQTSGQSGSHKEHDLKFNIVPAKVQNTPANYAFGYGRANIAIGDQVLHLSMQIKHASPATQYDVALSINGTATKMGSLVTNHGGNGEIAAELKLKPGIYFIGVLIYDASNFQAPTLVLTSDPSSLSAVVVASGNSESSSGSQSESESQSTTTVTAGEGDEQNIKLAVSSLAIPAVVQVGSSNTSFSVLDPRFSVSVGKQADDGLILSISATNVTGPKVLLLNLTQNAFLNLTSHALKVTLDGNPVVQASSVTQVLNPAPGDPARYVIVAASSSFQLLISIPHFSLHTIQIIPIPISQVQRLLVVNAEVLAASVVVITIVFAAVYRTRRKIFSLFL